MKRLEFSGFVPLERKDLHIRGGTRFDWESIRKIIDVVTSVIDAFNTYKKDFLRGYLRGKNGETLGLIQ